MEHNIISIKGFGRFNLLLTLQIFETDSSFLNLPKSSCPNKECFIKLLAQ